MPYRERRPPEALHGDVECIWNLDVPGRAVLPDGCMDIVWSSGRLLVAGPDTAPDTRPRSGAAAGVRFRPGALPALIGVPAVELSDRRVPLAELLPELAGPAVARLEHGEDPAAVLTEVALRLPGDPAPAWRHRVLRGTARGHAATDVADALGWTTRTLHRHCLAAFGYGPATLRRVLRFRRALALLLSGMAPADVAAATGYADQPHLSREVRAFSGASPAQLSGVKRLTSVPSGSATVA
ncbi:MAG: helix-turn-helix domain-containing protein [Pseudonocardia sp.]|nr:helix-turn-helix domain-containing protein [Pseudonocardia sp.]